MCLSQHLTRGSPLVFFTEDNFGHALVGERECSGLRVVWKDVRNKKTNCAMFSRNVRGQESSVSVGEGE